MKVYDELEARGLIAQVTDENEIRGLVNNGKAVFYIGFDPTADSLHVGHFMALCLMKRLQMAGNKPIVLIGGGTAMVGDPSGRTDMRQMMTEETIQHNVECFKKQMSRFIDFSEDKAIVVNNADWLMDLNYMEVLRDIGPHFSVNRILSAECAARARGGALSHADAQGDVAHDAICAVLQSRGVRLPRRAAQRADSHRAVPHAALPRFPAAGVLALPPRAGERQFRYGDSARRVHRAALRLPDAAPLRRRPHAHRRADGRPAQSSVPHRPPFLRRRPSGRGPSDVCQRHLPARPLYDGLLHGRTGRAVSRPRGAARLCRLARRTDRQPYAHVDDRRLRTGCGRPALNMTHGREFSARDFYS